DMTLLERDSGDVLAKTPTNEIFQPDVEFDPTGQFLFAGESSTEDAVLKRYDLSTNDFVQVGVTPDTYAYPARRIVYQSGRVSFAGHQLDAGTLADLGSFGEDIALITPDGEFAVSRRHVYRVSDFSEVDTLPVDSGVIAASPDSQALYQFDNET